MKKATSLLTEAELELMTILWRVGEASVHDVMSELPRGRELAYTSVSTILRILEQKGVIKARKEGRGHVYMPVLSKEDFEKRTLKHLVETVFDGTPLALVRQLLGSQKFAAEEIDEVRRMLSEMKKERS